MVAQNVGLQLLHIVSSGVKFDSGKVYIVPDTLFLETNTINASTATFFNIRI